MKYFISTLLLVIYSLSFAQIQWHENGVPVQQGENIVWNQTSVSCDDETIVSIWTDTRNGIRGVYAQKIDINGNSMWGDNGIEIYNPERMQSRPIAISSTNNSVITCWQDYNDPENIYSSQIRIQKIDANGNILWGEAGILLENSGANDGAPQIVGHSDGGVYVLWNETPQSDIKGIRLLADGSIAVGWEDGIEILPALYKYKTHSDHLDGVILSAALDDDIYIQRVDENGNKLWGYNGTLLYNGNDCILEIDICSSIADEYYFSWRTWVQNGLDELIMQKADSTGNPLWNSPTIISEENYIPILYAVCPSDSQPIVTWIIGETIFAQKINSDGDLLWGEEGIIVFDASFYLNRNSFILKEDIDDGCILSWEDNDYDYDIKILVQRINSNGDLLFGEDGLILYETHNYNSYTSLVITTQNYYFCWLGNSDNSQSLIQQIIDGDGNIYLEENGEEMFTGLSGSVDDIQLLSNEDNPIILWSDGRSFNKDRIYLQILNSDGSNVFAEDGIPITTFSQSDQNDLDAVFVENSGTIAAVWSENKVGYNQIYAQGVDTSGNYLWSDSTGLKVGGFSYHQDYPGISSINNSGTYEYYIGWEDFTDYMNSQIKGQKIINGNLLWGEDGKVIADREYNDELTDIVENYYIWQSGTYQNENIFCLMVDENGDPAPGWPENGLEICIAEGIQRKSRGIIVPQGLLILWEDLRAGSPSWMDIYGQIVTPDGNILWQENGLPLVAQENDQGNFKFIYDDGLYIIWQDFRSGSNYEIYAQKFDEDGNELWQVGGVLVAGVDEIGYENPDLVKVGNTIFIVWEERIDYEDRNIKAQLLGEDGELLWQSQGIILCDEFMDQKYPSVVSNGEDDVYIAWQDGRSTIFGDEVLMSIPGVYAQKVSLEPSFANDEIIKPIDVLCNYPNPFNPETTISFFTAEDAENAELVIYNIKGQKVKIISPSLCHPEFIEGRGQNKYSVTWNGTDENNKPVGSGVYFYNLKIGNKSLATKKCLLLK